MQRLTMWLVFACAMLGTNVAAGAPRFSQVGTVTAQPEMADATTHLVWQGCPMGLTGSTCHVGSVTTYNWHDALAVCAGLSWGTSGIPWRMPSVKELVSIVNDRNMSPAVDTTAFPNTPNDYFWTSTSLALTGAYYYAWNIWFYNGELFSLENVDKTANLDVRCVRSGP